MGSTFIFVRIWDALKTCRLDNSSEIHTKTYKNKNYSTAAYSFRMDFTSSLNHLCVASESNSLRADKNVCAKSTCKPLAVASRTTSLSPIRLQAHHIPRNSLFNVDGGVGGGLI